METAKILVFPVGAFKGTFYDLSDVPIYHAEIDRQCKRNFPKLKIHSNFR